MTQQSGKEKRELTAEQWAEYDRLASEKLSQTQIAKRLGIPQARPSRRLAERAQITPNGTRHEVEPSPTGHSTETFRRNVTAHPSAPERAPSTSLQRIELMGEPVSVEDSAPERTSTLLTDHETRLAVLESFMNTLQQQAHRSAPKRTSVPERTSAPIWIKRGTHLATDMAEALKDYAAKHRLEVREVHDMALREFFARHNAPAEEGTDHG